MPSKALSHFYFSGDLTIFVHAWLMGHLIPWTHWHFLVYISCLKYLDEVKITISSIFKTVFE